MGREARAVRELRPAIARVLDAKAGGARGLVLVGEQVHGGLGEVGEAAGVIGVEVGDDHVAHVGGAEPEALDPAQRGLLGIEARAHHGDEAGAEAAARVGEVGGAEAGVDEHEAVVALDEQAVADEARGRAQAAFAGDQAAADGAHGAAVEVVDAHQASSASARSSVAASAIGTGLGLCDGSAKASAARRARSPSRLPTPSGRSRVGSPSEATNRSIASARARAVASSVAARGNPKASAQRAYIAAALEC